MANTSISMPMVSLKEERTKSRSFWQDALLHLLRDRLTMAAFIGLALLTLVCFFAPPLVENWLQVNANRTSIVDRYTPPGPAHPLGTDHLGRDQLIRLLYGGQVSLSIAYIASMLSISIGVMLGLLAGYYGGRIDDVLIWFINTLQSIPAIFLLLIASTIWSPSPQVLILILSIFGWVGTCRLVRGEVFSLKERDYIMAAKALGSPNWRLMLYHMLPNVLSLIIVSLTINAGTLILIESGLSFLGLGVQPPTATWGNMLTDSRSYFAKGTYLVFWPGILISMTVLCFYLLGDGLRDALDPRSARK